MGHISLTLHPIEPKFCRARSRCGAVRRVVNFWFSLKMNFVKISKNVIVYRDLGNLPIGSHAFVRAISPLPFIRLSPNLAQRKIMAWSCATWGYFLMFLKINFCQNLKNGIVYRDLDNLSIELIFLCRSFLRNPSSAWAQILHRAISWFGAVWRLFNFWFSWKINFC